MFTLNKLKNNREFVFIFFILVAFIISFVLSGFNNLKILDAKFFKTSLDGRVISSSNSLVVYFSRPLSLENNEIKDFIKIKETNCSELCNDINDFSVKTLSDKIIISIEDSLKKDTKYLVNIESGIKDIYNKTINTIYKFEFLTEVPKIMYMKKNSLFLGDIKGNEEKLLTSELIKKYKSTSSGDLIFILEDDGFLKSSMSVFDIASKNLTSLDIPYDSYILDFDIDNKDNLWLLVNTNNKIPKYLLAQNINIFKKDKIKFSEVEGLNNVAKVSSRFKVNSNGSIQVLTFNGHILTDIYGSIIIPTEIGGIGVENQSNKSIFGFKNNLKPFEPKYANIYELNSTNNSKILYTVSSILESFSIGYNSELIFSTLNKTKNEDLKMYSVSILDQKETKLIKEISSISHSYENIKVDSSKQYLALEEIELKELINEDYNLFRKLKDSNRTINANILLFDLLNPNIELYKIKDAYGLVWVN